MLFYFETYGPWPGVGRRGFPQLCAYCLGFIANLIGTLCKISALSNFNSVGTKNQAFVLQCAKELHDWLEPLIGKFFCCFRKEPFSAKKSSAHWNCIDKKEGKNEGNSEKVRSFFGRWRELTVLL